MFPGQGDTELMVGASPLLIVGSMHGTQEPQDIEGENLSETPGLDKEILVSLKEMSSFGGWQIETPNSSQHGLPSHSSRSTGPTRGEGNMPGPELEV